MQCRAISRLVAVAVLSASLVGVGATTGPAGASDAAAQQTGRACNANTYKPKFRTNDVVASPEVTQLGARTLPPGGSRRVTSKVATRARITAGARLSGEVSTKIQNKLIKNAEAKVGLSLSAAGASTRTKKRKVTETVSNPTDRNQKFVFFRGTTKVTGNARASYCDAQDGSGDGTVKWRTGRVTSFTIIDQGVARCGAGSTGAVAREALSIGCR